MTGAVEARGALSTTFYLLVYLFVQEHSALFNIPRWTEPAVWNKSVKFKKIMIETFFLLGSQPILATLPLFFPSLALMYGSSRYIEQRTVFLNK